MSSRHNPFDKWELEKFPTEDIEDHRDSIVGSFSVLGWDCIGAAILSDAVLLLKMCADGVVQIRSIMFEFFILPTGLAQPTSFLAF